MTLEPHESHMDTFGQRAYLWPGGDMLKRNADRREKMSVASMAVGIFQKEVIGIFILPAM
jgi:hypothetical protein